MPTISELFVYPIKSCGGIALREARLLATGLEYDRYWMVTHPDGAMLTQRAYPRMALIKVEIGADDADHSRTRHERIAHAARRRPTRRAAQGADHSLARRGLRARHRRCCRRVVFELSRPAGAASAFRSASANVRSIRTTPSSVGGATTYFADGFPLLVVGQASLDDLNTRLISKGAPSIPIDRFRPNVVLTGLDAYEEDYVETLSVERRRRRRSRACSCNWSSCARAVRCRPSIRRRARPTPSGRTNPPTR